MTGVNAASKSWGCQGFAPLRPPSEEHMKLAQYFSREADRLEAESRRHQELASEYRHSPISQAMAVKNPMGPRTAVHCDFFAKAADQSAQKARGLAADHQQMATEAEN